MIFFFLEVISIKEKTNKLANKDKGLASLLEPVLDVRNGAGSVFRSGSDETMAAGLRAVLLASPSSAACLTKSCEEDYKDYTGWGFV